MKFYPLVFFILIIPLLPIHLDHQIHPRLVIWNVGQGLWVSWVNHQSCWHFDIGGEFADWSSIEKLCYKKENKIYLSHWDWDHIKFMRQAHRRLKNVCLALLPQKPVSSEKERFIKPIPLCLDVSLYDSAYTSNRSSHLSLLKWSFPRVLTGRRRPPRYSENDLSHVLILHDKALLPGDSTRRAERQWSKQIKHNQKIKYLILGHHGSQTSTSKELLDQLPQLQLAIASARKARYGHPHISVRRRLKDFHVPLLTTEAWGHIHILWEPIP